MMARCDVFIASSVSRLFSSVPGTGFHGNEKSDSINRCEFVDWLGDHT